ncbi:ferrochelatase [Polymorphobacter sp. PAMC 29334]|uniref:ferrochelatase n=1 Tax=Polymorphobacter sp. PAMC 29334 TaxID=2862331 RepID=UPI001C758E9B|nr:ferrochelatase [Polymorphobacter sp. PAMC 29334]QYE35835.1 ferrochelatase [Polymorphobacter sp. PAMC 29334]
MSSLPPDHPPVAFGRIGVLLVNLGTPDSPETGPVRRYLAEFLSDRRVVELPPILWQPLLRGVVLVTRPKRTAANYAKIWDREANDSPLRVITTAQAASLSAALGDGVIVDWAMRYGSPSIPDRLQALKDAGCERILIAPLYPQYSSATTGTVNDKVFATLMKWRWQPALRTLPPYHDDPIFLDALAASFADGVAGLDFVPDLLLTSFHGMPRSTLDKGDPYHCQCRKTARLMGERISTPLRVSFQSRLGRAEWLKPYTDVTLAELPAQGIRKLVVMSPGFSADNLETLEEVAMEGRATFLEAGGTDFAYIPCLNAGAIGNAALTAIVRRELAGWVPAP